MTILVSVIIPTFNRFKFLLNAIKSVKEQTYKNYEIIVVNDCSTEPEYYTHDFGDIKIIHLEKNSKDIFGFSCPGGYQRNIGIKQSSGKYIAFLDDDDTWYPTKLETQIYKMRESGAQMSCTDAIITNIKTKSTMYYNREYARNYIVSRISQAKKLNKYYINGTLPTIWDKEFLKINNSCICSSVIVSKHIIDKVGEFIIAHKHEDYEYWLRVLDYTKCIYIDEGLVHYDITHGNGRNWK